MPFFKSTHNIFKSVAEDEVFDISKADSNKIYLPPKRNWDYKRELQIEDVNIWEVILEESGARAVYAAWDPYAEFYLVRPGWYYEIKYGFETYYGPEANKKVQKRMKELDMPVHTFKIWVEPEDMWLYSKE